MPKSKLKRKSRSMSIISEVGREVVKEGVRLDKLTSSHVYNLLVIVAFGAISCFCIYYNSYYNDASSKQISELAKAVNKLAEIVNTNNGCNIVKNQVR